MCRVIIVSNPTQLSQVEVVLRLSWDCDNFKATNIIFLSQTEPWEILVRVAKAMHTACARGYSHAHNTLILVYISVHVAIATRTCAWLSHAHVYSIQIRLLDPQWTPKGTLRG